MSARDTSGTGFAVPERSGMRVAFVGSGGSGKSVIAGTLARLLAQRGRKVLAVDLDPNPGLPYSLGLGAVEGGLTDDLIAPVEGASYGWDLAPGLDPASVIERAAWPAPDGVRYLTAGTIDRPDHEVGRSLGAVRRITRAAASEWDVIGDLEAGTTTPYEGYADFAARIVVTVTPSWRSALTARRLLGLLSDDATTVVASRWRDELPHAGLRPAVCIPADPAVALAEREGRAPIDVCGSPVVEAISRLADLLDDTCPLDEGTPARVGAGQR